MNEILDQVLRQPLSDALYLRLKACIVEGVYQPGDRLPSERALSEEHGVNRGAVREAIKRLQQSGLVAVRQGGKHEVLDYRQHGSLDLLAGLLLNSRGQINPRVVRDVMRMRSALAPEIAAEAARLGGAALCARLEATVSVMEGNLQDLASAQVGAMHFWQTLTSACDNIAYQLAFNTMRRSYHEAWDTLTLVMAREFQDVVNLRAIVHAVRTANPDAARVAARAHVELGREAVEAVLAAL
jgi:DNA-binding FadR family transcriptional regulator